MSRNPSPDDLQQKVAVLEQIIKDLQLRNQEVEGRNRELEGRNREVEGRNRELERKLVRRDERITTLSAIILNHNDIAEGDERLPAELDLAALQLEQVVRDDDQGNPQGALLDGGDGEQEVHQHHLEEIPEGDDPAGAEPEEEEEDDDRPRRVEWFFCVKGKTVRGKPRPGNCDFKTDQKSLMTRHSKDVHRIKEPRSRDYRVEYR